MIEKQEFYHGAALIRLLEDERCKSVRKHGAGYKVNDEISVLLKYSTKSRTPWRFSFGKDEVERLELASRSFPRVAVALICGGDGICGLTWEAVEKLLSGKAGWLTAARKFAGQYAVIGPAGRMKGKVSLSRWPAVLFSAEEGGKVTS